MSPSRPQKGIASRRPLRRTKCEVGQDLVEFALVMPLLILVTFGVLEFGVVISNYNTVANAAREGARYGITHPDQANSGVCGSGKTGVVGAACKQAVNLTPAKVSITTTSDGGSLTVKVNYSTQFLTAYMLETVLDESVLTLNLQASASMRLEQ